MSSPDYAEFLKSKLVSVPPAGFDYPADKLPALLKQWQRDVTGWALRKGRGALFLGTGLGKTFIELSWGFAVADYTKKPVLLLAPLAVGPQTLGESRKFGIECDVQQATCDADVTSGGIYITNYEKLHKFDPAKFAGIIADESSCIKHMDSKTKNLMCEMFKNTPYKLPATATPSPNDHTELASHAEFLGVCTRQEMLATYFVHDSGDTSEWRLKGHAEAAFWKWVASWAVMARRPRDLGYDDSEYELPELRIVEHEVGDTTASSGRLFVVSEETLSGQRKARRETLELRVAKAAEIANATDEPVIAWCELNPEGDALEKQINGAVQVAGKDKDADKIERLTGFVNGKYRAMVSKPSMFGFGLNLQFCGKMVFVGLSHSWEDFFQAVRRCWRFGRTEPVEVHIVTSEKERAVLENIKRKQKLNDEMVINMIKYTSDVNREDIMGKNEVHDEYNTNVTRGDGWEIVLGDNVETIKSVEDNSVGFMVTSIPFSSLYTYSASPRDMGNCRNDFDFFAHMKFLIPELIRTLKPGRLISVHCMNLPTSKANDGYTGIRDFRGDVIKAFVECGFIYHSEVTIWKDPVTAMQRTKALGLLHKQIKKDSCMSRMGIPDYVETFRKPGENPEPVSGKFDRYIGDDGTGPEGKPEKEGERYSIEVWQRYASPVWSDINQTRVLSYTGARERNDERHVCPLQLDVIERCIELWSNEGDLILDPFNGIGSSGYVALLNNRKYIGLELKQSYVNQAIRHLTDAENKAKQKDLFSDAADD